MRRERGESMFNDNMDEYMFGEICRNVQNAYVNLFLLAIKKRINLFEIVELLDGKIDEFVDKIPFDDTPECIEGVMFLASASKMMDYSLFDVLYLSEYEKTNIIIDLIEEIDITDIKDYEVLSPSDKRFYYIYDIANNEKKQMGYTLEFIEDDDICKIKAGVITSAGVGFVSDLMIDFVTLWEGNKGEICRFIVETIEDLIDADEKTKQIRTKSTEEPIDYEDFFIHSNNTDCFHSCIKVMATMPIYSNGKETTISFIADYCPECGIYYISENTYYNEILPTGRLLCPVMSLDEYLDYRKQNYSNGELRVHSIINMLGYNVNSKVNLSEHERRTILKYAIGFGYISKKLTIFYLQTFIKKASPKETMKKAISKWKSDLQWVMTFDGKNDIIYGVRRIIDDSDEGGFASGSDGLFDDLPFK